MKRRKRQPPSTEPIRKKVRGILLSQQYKAKMRKCRHNILFCKGFNTSKRGDSVVAWGDSIVAQGDSAVATKSRNPCNYCVSEVEFSSVLISTY